MTRVALYLRVSTGEQSVENQRRELMATAERRRWVVTHEIADEGISGAKGKDRRPGLAHILNLVTRRQVDMVAAWSVDRLGRSLQDLIEVLETLRVAGVDL
jgi:DNA invertase Pin-like site-specific DNA recombinase